jgi:CheY-like chemotaxis protein
MVKHYQEAHQENIKAFEDQLPEMIAEIEKNWAEAKDLLIASESQPEKQSETFEKLNNLHVIFHKLAGSSSMLGYSKLASIATVMDNHVKQREMSNVNNYIKEFESWLEVIHLAVKKDKSRLPSLDVYSIETQVIKEKRAHNLIFLVEDDPIQARELEIQVGYFGYTIKTFTQLKDLGKALREQQPTAIIMDVIFPEGDTAGPDFITKHLSSNLTETVQKIPVIFVSTSDTLISRLQAVRLEVPLILRNQ